MIILSIFSAERMSFVPRPRRICTSMQMSMLVERRFKRRVFETCMEILCLQIRNTFLL